MIYLPRGIPVRQKVNPARINLPEAMEKLRVGAFTGYLRFDAPEGSGVVIFEKGKLVSALFIDAAETERLIAYDAIARIFEVSILGHAVLNIYRLSVDLAIGLHALLHGSFLCQGQDLKLLNIKGLLERIRLESLTGCLRVYTPEKTVLIFYDHGNALGFFHDGSADIEVSADLAASVAALPGAKLDLLEMRDAADLALADLMASADLGPIWRRSRKLLLEERRKTEEAAVRSQEEELEKARQRMLTSCKAIAGNHVGKFGVTQVEKAFSQVGTDLRPRDLTRFYAELERLAKLVAGPAKISSMLEEMKKQFPPG